MTCIDTWKESNVPQKASPHYAHGHFYYYYDDLYSLADDF